MRFVPTALPEVLLVEGESHADERGSFERVWSAPEFAAAGPAAATAQVSLSRNLRAGTVRGLHYAAAPHGETKLVRCVAGAVFDVAVDVRPGSPTFGRHVALRLDGDGSRALRIPPGFAHGFQTLAPDTVVLYVIDVPYAAAAARAVRYDDPALAIAWPLPVSSVSQRDAAAPLLAAV